MLAGPFSIGGTPGARPGPVFGQRGAGQPRHNPMLVLHEQYREPTSRLVEIWLNALWNNRLLQLIVGRISGAAGCLGAFFVGVRASPSNTEGMLHRPAQAGRRPGARSTTRIPLPSATPLRHVCADSLGSWRSSNWMCGKEQRHQCADTPTALASVKLAFGTKTMLPPSCGSRRTRRFGRKLTETHCTA